MDFRTIGGQRTSRIPPVYQAGPATEGRTTRMLLIERHLLRQFAETFAAVAIVLLLVSLGGLLADLIGEIARGKVPAALLLSQLGLRSIRFFTLVLPLALFVGLLMAVGRMYAENEMAVLASVGLGPQQLWRPIVLVSLPVVFVVGLASLWLAPWSARTAEKMIESANRSFLVAGLEPGRFVELPGRAGVLYVSELTPDGTRFKQLFVQRERDGRLDIITAHGGDLQLIGETQRILRLDDGFRVEGAPGSRDFRMMHFERNEIRVPDREASKSMDDFEATPTLELFRSPSPAASGELHWRLGTPLFAVLLALLALPMARSEPRTPRYGRLIAAFLAYLVGMNMLILGTSAIASGTLPGWLGLWWLHLPALALAAWLFWRDGRPSARARA
jgi:lipopolysaccharide export system permease protein